MIADRNELLKPEQFAYLDLFKVFVFFNIEVIKVEKVVLSSFGQSSQAIKDCQFVGTGTRGGIVEQRQRTQCWIGPSAQWWCTCITLEMFLGRRSWARGWRNAESMKSLLRGPMEVQYLPTAYKANCVCPLRRCVARIKAYHVLRHCLEFVIEFHTESVQLSKVKRPKVKKEVPVDEFIVNAEIMYRLLSARGITLVSNFLRWLGFQSNVIQSILWYVKLSSKPRQKWC